MESFGEFAEYFYFESSILCFCKTTEIYFYEGGPPIV